jgi:hypothetical protein
VESKSPVERRQLLVAELLYPVDGLADQPKVMKRRTR